MNSDHPSTDELLAFALGLCDPASVEAIAAHLEVCDRCAEQFDDLATDTDPFVSALRDAFHPARTQETQATPPDSEPGVRPFDSPATPEIGSLFGRYEVKGLLGRGQMGVVYRAHDPRLARDIALKVQNCDLSAGPAELSRVENEARSAAQLKHPNIVQVYDQGIHEGRPFCAMELVEGQDLGCYKPRAKPVGTGDCLAAGNACPSRRPRPPLRRHPPRLEAGQRDDRLRRDRKTRVEGGRRWVVDRESQTKDGAQ